jgi:hypothetical protein
MLRRGQAGNAGTQHTIVKEPAGGPARTVVAIERDDEDHDEQNEVVEFDGSRTGSFITALTTRSDTNHPCRSMASGIDEARSTT